MIPVVINRKPRCPVHDTEMEYDGSIQIPGGLISYFFCPNPSCDQETELIGE